MVPGDSVGTFSNSSVVSVEHLVASRDSSRLTTSAESPGSSIPAASSSMRATRAARSAPYIDVTGELWAMARPNSPSAAGIVISAVTRPAPADSPNTVTLSGSPPKAEMWSRTHASAVRTSLRPTLDSKRGLIDDRSANPRTPSR